MQGYESEKDEEGIPVMSMKRESRNADVRKDKVLHQEVKQLEELKEKKTSQPIHWDDETMGDFTSDLAFRWAEVRTKYRVEPQKWSDFAEPKLRSKSELPISEKAERKWSRYILRVNFSWTLV